VVYGRKPVVALNESAKFQPAIIAKWLPASNLFSAGSRDTLQNAHLCHSMILEIS